MLMRFPAPVVVIAPLTVIPAPRRITSPAICVAPLTITLPELEGVPTSNNEVALERTKLLPIVIEVENEVFAGTTFIEPEELKLKYAAALSQIESISNTAPPPTLLLKTKPKDVKSAVEPQALIFKASLEVFVLLTTTAFVTAPAYGAAQKADG